MTDETIKDEEPNLASLSFDNPKGKSAINSAKRLVLLMESDAPAIIIDNEVELLCKRIKETKEKALH